MLAQILRNYQVYLPFIVIIMLILGVIAIFMLIKMSRRQTRRSAERKALERPYPVQNLSSHFESSKNWLSQFTRKLVIFFKNTKTDSTETLTKSIDKVCHIMGRLYGIKQAQYQVPWYLMLSPTDGDHKFMLNSIESKLFLTPDEQTVIDTDDQAFNWLFYDQAVVIDHQHPSSLDHQTSHQHEVHWLKFLEYIARKRAKRPLDALIVTLPVHYIYGNDALNHEDITVYARLINNKLTQIQNRLGMRLPVYVILSKCEAIAGFENFVAALPTSSHGEIFGWSSPYALDTNFTSSWVDDMFLSMRETLDKIRMAIFAEASNTPDQDSHVEFSTQISSLKNNLNTYLMGLFDGHRHHEPHFLRGVYFTAKITAHTLALPQLDIQPDLSARSFNSMTANPSSERAVFIKDLFSKKIFAESNLGHPIFNMLISTSKRLNYLKLLCGLGVIIWSAGLIHQFRTLRNDNRSFMPALQTVDQALKGLSIREWDPHHNLSNQNDSIQRLKYLDDQTTVILERFADIDNSDSFAISMPSSWFSQLDQHIKTAFIAAFNSIIMPALSMHLIKQGHDLTAAGHAYGYNNPNQINLNPRDSVSFKILQSYVKNVVEFEQAVDTFNINPAQRNAQDLSKIYKYVYSKNLPIQFLGHARYYETAYQQSQAIPIDIQQYQLSADQKLKALYNKFLSMAFNVHQNYPALVNLQKNLDDLAAQKSKMNASDISLTNINQEAILVADMISDEQFAWIELSTFNPADEYQQLINLISGSHIFGQTIAQELLKVAHQDFVKFKLDLMNYKSMITGPFLSIKDGQLAALPSDGLVNFIDALSLFLTEPFMAKFNNQPLVRKIPKGKLLFWDHTVLKDTGDLFDSFNAYLNTKLQQVSPNLQPLFKTMARSHLHHKVMANLSRAQLLQSSIVDQLNLSYTDALRAQVENLAMATPLFAKILESLDRGVLGFDLMAIRQILVDQTYDILSKIDALLEADNLYRAREAEFDRWQGEPQLGLKAFGVNDVHQMKNYLNAQRYQIQFLSKELAEPVLTLLGLGFFESSAVQIPLVLKWSRIAAVLQDYDKQSPSNSLKILEQFLTHDFNNVTFENCQLDVIEWDDLAGGDDYFLNILNHYRDGILSRCYSANNQKVDIHYQKLSQFFNNYLADRFPFTNQVEATTDKEATPADVITFLQLYNNFAKYHQRSSDHALNPAARKFVDDVARIQPLLIAMVGNGNHPQDSGLSFQMAFRTEQAREIDGDKIIDWFINIDDRRIGIRSDNKETYWQIGDPIDVHLRWAANGDTVPIADPHQPQLKVTRDNAVFSFRGAWSLIHLLKAQSSSKSWLDQPNTAQAQTLEFDIPTVNRTAKSTCVNHNTNRSNNSIIAQVFSRMTISLPDSSSISTSDDYDSINAQSITLLPDFPTQAPVLEIRHNPYQYKQLHTPKSHHKSKTCQQLSRIKIK